MRRSLFWCSTVDGRLDNWVVGFSPVDVVTFFAIRNGYAIHDVGAEYVRPVVSAISGVYEPERVELQRWGVVYNESFRVYSYKGRIFRPDGAERARQSANAQERNRQRRRLQLVK
jgi:hypothetical protein